MPVRALSGSPIRVAAIAFACAMPIACEHGRTEASAIGGTTTAASVASAPTQASDSGAPRARSDSARGERASVQSPSVTLDPAATVRAYLTTLRTHSAARDTTLWERSTGSDDGFRTFRDTAIAAFAVGAPGRIEGAAGSRYVELPLTVDLATTTSPVQLRGRATLRRTVVDGATALQRQWRIVRIQWGAPTAPTLDSDSAHR